MAFGQSAGPPASHRQVQQLTELIHAAGHTDFRDARGPLGLSQRQAGGRFTREEADALIARLELEADRAAPAGEPEPGGADPAAERSRPLGRREAELANRLHELPADVLGAELQRRGWVVMEP
jgi:hypothetical protein